MTDLTPERKEAINKLIRSEIECLERSLKDMISWREHKNLIEICERRLKETKELLLT